MDNKPNIKIITSDDDLKILGNLLSNKSSRDMISLLMNKEMYQNEISANLNLRPNLVAFHMNRLRALGLVEITTKRIRMKYPRTHNYYKINSDIFITVNKTHEEIEKTGLLKSIFKESVKIVS